MPQNQNISAEAECTIIVPIYNAVRYIGELTASIKNQSSKSWRCIFVDDGSTDCSLEMLKNYALHEPRFTVITQKNAGCGAARNAALKRVKTPFLMFADQDDIMHPQAVEIALSAVKAAQVDCLLFGYCKFYPSPAINEIKNREEPVPTERNGKTLITGRRDSWPIFVWRYIFRTANGQYTPFPHISGGEDQSWMTELSWKNLKWAEIKTVLYFNRDNPLSQSRALSANYIKCVFYSYKWIEERSKLYGIDQAWIKKFTSHMAFMFRLSICYRKIRGLLSSLYLLSFVIALLVHGCIHDLALVKPGDRLSLVYL